MAKNKQPKYSNKALYDYGSLPDHGGSPDQGYNTAYQKAYSDPEYQSFRSTGKVPKTWTRDDRAHALKLSEEYDERGPLEDFGSLIKKYNSTVNDDNYNSDEMNTLSRAITTHPNWQTPGSGYQYDDADVNEQYNKYINSYYNKMLPEERSDMPKPTGKPGDLREVLKSYAAKGNISPESYNLLLGQLNEAYGKDWQNNMSPDERGLFAQITTNAGKGGNSNYANTENATQSSNGITTREKGPDAIDRVKKLLDETELSPQQKYKYKGTEEGRNNSYDSVIFGRWPDVFRAGSNWKDVVDNDEEVKAARAGAKWAKDLEQTNKDTEKLRKTFSDRIFENTKAKFDEQQRLKDESDYRDFTDSLNMESALQREPTESKSSDYMFGDEQNPTKGEVEVGQGWQTAMESNKELAEMGKDKLMPMLQKAEYNPELLDAAKADLEKYQAYALKNDLESLNALGDMVSNIDDPELRQQYDNLREGYEIIGKTMEEEGRGTLSDEEVAKLEEVMKKAKEMEVWEKKYDPKIQEAKGEFWDRIKEALFFTKDALKSYLVFYAGLSMGNPQLIMSAMDTRNHAVAQSETNFSVKKQDAATENMFRNLTKDNIAQYLNTTDIQPYIKKLTEEYKVKEQDVPEMVVKGLEKAYEEYNKASNKEGVGFQTWYLNNKGDSNSPMNAIINYLLLNSNLLKDKAGEILGGGVSAVPKNDTNTEIGANQPQQNKQPLVSGAIDPNYSQNTINNVLSQMQGIQQEKEELQNPQNVTTVMASKQAIQGQV